MVFGVVGKIEMEGVHQRRDSNARCGQDRIAPVSERVQKMVGEKIYLKDAGSDDKRDGARPEPRDSPPT